MTTESMPKSPIASDLTQMRVALPLPCARCGYDVRNLAADGDCPECGEPIRLTIIEVVDPATRRLEPIQNQKFPRRGSGLRKCRLLCGNQTAAGRGPYRRSI